MTKRTFLRGILLAAGLAVAGYFSPLLGVSPVSMIPVRFLIGRIAYADSVNDVESDVDTVISNSVEAQTEAAAAKAQAHKEKTAEEKWRKREIQKEHEAKVEEATAKRKIRRYDLETAHNQKLQKLFKRQIFALNKRIAMAEALVKKSHNKLSFAKAELNSAKNQKSKLEQTLTNNLRQKEKLQNKIQHDSEQTTSLTKDIVDLKNKQKTLDRNLVVLRQKAFRAAVARDKMKLKRNRIRRQVSSIPTQVIVRAPKSNCDVLAGPTSGANKVGEIFKGQRYALYRIVNGWVEVQLKSARGYAARSCF